MWARIASSLASISRANSKSNSFPRGRSQNGCGPGGAESRRYAADGSVEVASPPKETRRFDERDYVLEEGIVCDYALVRASIGDRYGNLIYDKATRNFNPLCAMAGKITIAEVERLVAPGDIDPQDVHTPGIFVQRVVVVGQEGKRIERVTTRKHGN
jgi:3-oxoacid CoA-transferase subunit A